MNTEAIDKFVKFLKSKSYSVSKANAATYNLFFVKNGQTRTMYQAQPREFILELKKDIALFNPELITVEIMYENRKEIHQLDTTKEPSDYPENAPEQVERFNYRDNQTFGSTDPNPQINQQVQVLLDQRLEKAHMIQQIESLKMQLQQQDKLVDEKERQIQKLVSEQEKSADGFNQELESKQKEIEEKAKEIEHLEKVIKDKKNFRYYAGLTGDILQSFGIKKEMIAKPLAGLLAGAQDTEATAIEQTAFNDTSGIVDDEATSPVSAEQKSRRQEMIDLLMMYLQNIDTLTIEKLFAIFSEIESDKALADELILYISQNKHKSQEESS